MRGPSLTDLPPPPPGLAGWPWTVAHPPLADTMPSGSPWPRISIVTPSYNQGPFLEETIRSVLLQGYPDLEYIVLDGGSGDESTDILRRYAPWLAYWTSKPDRGQADAINRGFGRASGELFGWLNSDDVYEPGCMQRIATHFAQRPNCGLLYGSGWYIDAQGTVTRRCNWIRPFQRDRLLTFNFILQPAAFWRRSVWEETGDLEVAYHWAMDWDWFIRATASQDADYIPVDLARFRLRPEIKTLTGGEARAAEVAAISRRYGGIYQPTYMLYRLNRFGAEMARRVGPGRFGAVIQSAFDLTAWLLRGVVWRGRSLL